MDGQPGVAAGKGDEEDRVAVVHFKAPAPVGDGGAGAAAGRGGRGGAAEAFEERERDCSDFRWAGG